MTKQPIRFALVLAAVLAFSACSAHPRRVDCKGHLTPINAPAPVTLPSASRP